MNEATLANLRGEDLDSQNLAEDDPRATPPPLEVRIGSSNHDTDPYPEHLEVSCPHCGSPDNEWGEKHVSKTDLSTVDMNGNPKPGLTCRTPLD